jgi:ferredoxin|tara:strand:+ start:2816 stop:3175 length:360 start_codon:yes stop_codon:yes gene_type:complete
MSYIIGMPCEGTCDTACVAVCPVDCIHGPIDINGRGQEVANMEIGKTDMLYINPAECIDCGACLPECPVDAIYPNEEYAVEKDGTDEYVNRNYEFFNQKWKSILPKNDDKPKDDKPKLI